MKSNKLDRNKNSKTKKTAVLAVLVLLSIFASSCTTFDNFKSTFFDKSKGDEEKVITIGVFEPQTGRNAKKGQEEIKGIELANSIYGSVDGYRVVLTKVDTQSSVSSTKTAVQSLIEMNPVALIGSADEASSLAAGEIIEEAKIPTITPSATNPLITQGNDYYFRASLTDSQMGQGLAEYACEEKGSRSVGIVTLKNDSSVAAMLDGFEAGVKEIAGRKSKAIAVQKEINPTEKEMRDAILTLQMEGSDICFAPLGTENLDTFFRIIEEREMTDMVFLGSRSWGEEEFITMMENHPKIKIVFPYESVLSGTDSTTDAITKEAQRFQIEYANRYGDEDVPTYNAALGYDSYLLLINAIHNAKSLEGSKIKNVLLELSDMKCSTGTFSFDSTGNVIRSVTLSTLKDGKPVSEYVSELEAKSEKLDNVEEQQAEAEEKQEQENTTETSEDESEQSAEEQEEE